MAASIDFLLEGAPGSWMAECLDTCSPAVSSRVRLARNVAGRPFPVRAGDDARAALASEAVQALLSCPGCAALAVIPIPPLSLLDRRILLECRLASADLCAGRPGSILVVSRDGRRGAMVNEEDHLRIQSLRGGLRLDEAWGEADALDTALAERLPYAFHPRYGHLTSCMTNLGTGLRASVMLHLPALRLSGQLEAAVRGLGKLGMAVRGVYGEGSESEGDMHQVSNQWTLGESEAAIIARLAGVVRRLVEHEEAARHRLLASRGVQTRDAVGRAYGLLKHARTISNAEAQSALSMVRMGVDLGLFRSLEPRQVNSLLFGVLPAHVQKAAGAELPEAERDAARASIIRAALRSPPPAPPPGAV